MRVFIDDGSTNVKVVWKDGDTLKTHISPNSFRLGWSPAFSQGPVHNYIIDGEKYTFDTISPETLQTNTAQWQYSPENTLAIHHALLTSGLEPQDVEIVVTLPLAEFYDADGQYRTDNIERKKKSVMRNVQLKNGTAFTLKKVTVRPESIPAGINISNSLKEGQAMLIVDLGGTTLDLAIVAAEMASVSSVKGFPTIGVSLVTNRTIEAVKLVDGTDISRLNAERIVMRRGDASYIADHIQDAEKAAEIQALITDAIATLASRVIREVAKLSGYTHILLVGGGAELVADALREHSGFKEERFIVPDNAQLALAFGLEQLG